MSIALPYPQPPRLRAEPVAELSGFVACNKPAWQRAIHNTGKTQLPRHPGSQSLLHCAESTSRLTTAAACNSSHERTLEMLRTVLSSSMMSSPSDSDTGAIKHETKSVVSQASKMSAGLEVHRATFLESLYDVQDSAAESIAATNALLCNRVKLGLLDSASAKNYYAQMAQAADGDDMLAISIGFADESDEQHQLGDGEGDISSSLNSNGSSDTLTPDDTEMAVDISGDDNDEPQQQQHQQQPAQGTKASLIEMWATNGFWRGVSTRAWSSYTQQRRRRSSACSGSTLATGVCDIEADKDTDADNIEQTASATTAAISDEMSICWPLDDASRERTRSVGRFYTDLGGLHVPSRYRTPNRSLAMLATEQRMMVNDKIVCPLKNRLQEPNPGRQQFEDYIREIGSLALAQSAFNNKSPSPLCNQLH
ncbi:hypothetical protein LPJ59_001910 [Coemansia sp. RSA 2399]|nr:hypothetical protein LPJ59_001910 [Coemansia sp. RSA 2399]KAJ1906000.1 hypothetical protein LPJ81_001602 [Coemansia sp. IMI 209127]